MGKGIRRRITIGFLSIALLMLCSGVFSYIELSTLSNKTQNLLNASRLNIEMTRNMLDDIQNQHAAILDLVTTGDSLAMSSVQRSREHFETLLDSAKHMDGGEFDLRGVLTSYDTYIKVVDTYEIASLEQNVEWFRNEFSSSYYPLTTEIKSYMTTAQSSLSSQVSSLEKNAYRSVTPNLITLVVMVLIVLMFLFFVDTYILKPIVNINKSLYGFIHNRIPFTPRAEFQSDLKSLKENIDKLIIALRAAKSNRG